MHLQKCLTFGVHITAVPFSFGDGVQQAKPARRAVPAPLARGLFTEGRAVPAPLIRILFTEG